ncbi:uncharacterized protein JCM10292_005452 [Rhodotorula paludigena]|uniref:uncharacterized protein n=1 Tax=Rhodotorula paludigena TaxID=86838 RepID=UPI00317C7920
MSELLGSIARLATPDRPLKSPRRSSTDGLGSSPHETREASRSTRCSVDMVPAEGVSSAAGDGNGATSAPAPRRAPLTPSSTANALATPSTPLVSSSSLSLGNSPGSDLASHLASLSLVDPSDISPRPTHAQEGGKEVDSPSAVRGPPLPSTNGRGASLWPPSSSGTPFKATTGAAFSESAGATSAAPEAPVLDELALLGVSSSVTELLMGIQEVNTLLFEIQELRHATSAAPSNDPHRTPRPPSSGFDASPEHPQDSNDASAAAAPVSEVDGALMRLEDKMDEVRKDFVAAEEQVKPLLEKTFVDARGELAFMRRKWDDAVHEWETVQKDAELLNDELKEDKWLVVFRSVSGQAVDMMRSLDKVLTQSQQFIADVQRRVAATGQPTSSGLPRSPSAPAFSSSSPNRAPFAGDTARAQQLLSAHGELYRSLRAKVKYYSPACERVLKILGKGIADRSTKNGEVLRRYGEMKAQWKGLQERIQLIEADMHGVERLLKQAAGTNGRQAEFGSTLTPPRDIASPGRLPLRRSPSALGPLSSVSGPSYDTPTRGGPLKPSSSSPTIATLGTVASPDEYGGLRASTSRPTPPRPPKSLKRLVSDSHATPASTGLTPPRPAYMLSHRRSVSALSSSMSSSLSASHGSGYQPRRPVSPVSSVTRESRPRWNPSVKPVEDRDVLSASASKPRSGRTSAMGLARPSSRLSVSSSMSRSYGPGAARPASPAFSDTSSVAPRDRPETPSKIPRPSSVMRRQSGAFGFDDPDMSASLARAVSPTPSHSRPPISGMNRYSLSRSFGPPPLSASRSRVQGPKTPSRPISPALSNSSSLYYRSQTPEPSLMAQAQRLASVRAPPSASRPPPVPRVPSTYRQDGQATPRTSSTNAARLSRPPSSLSSYRPSLDRATTPGGGDSSHGAYIANAHDPLDVTISGIVNSLPLLLHVTRVDAPLSRVQAGQIELFQARYALGLPGQVGAPAMCKLVDRVGPRAKKGEKKVLVRVGGGWQDLEAHCLSLLASGV